jgi:hypothetical protein
LSLAGLVPNAFESLTGEERNSIYQMLRLEVTPASEGYKATGALGGFLHSETDGLREATVKKLNGAKLWIPSGLSVKAQAMGLGTTELISACRGLVPRNPQDL